MKKSILIIACILIFLPSCIYAVRYEGDYRGKVIDADTNEPIEGVVVLGVWYKEYTGAPGAIHKFYDARETVTDKNGEFSIPGMGLMIISNVIARFSIFKAGYFYNDYTSWETFSKGNVIIRLKKLTMEQWRKGVRLPDPPSEAPLEKVILMLREIDKHDKKRGLERRGIWNGEKYE